MVHEPLPNHIQAAEVLHALPHAIWISEPDGFVKWVNKWACIHFGRTFRESLGHQHMGLLHPDDKTIATTAWAKSCDSGKILAVDYRMKVASGEYRWTAVKAQPVRKEDGAIWYWIGSCTDIHEQLGRVERLRLQAGRQRSQPDEPGS